MREKKSSEKSRVIIDLSFPKGQGVNNSILKGNFQGKELEYKLSTINTLIDEIKRQGQGAYIWKADLSRAYRQLRLDIYLCPSFRCRISASACQRITSGVAYLRGDGKIHQGLSQPFSSHYQLGHINLPPFTLAKAVEGHDTYYHFPY